MKLLISGGDPETSERLGLAVRLRWPDATLRMGAVDDTPAVIEEDQPDLVMLRLGSGAGAVVEAVRATRRDSDVPIIVIETRDGDQSVDEVATLEAGADDYVRFASPFDLAARVVAVMRRSARGGEVGNRDEMVIGGQILLNPQTHEVFIGRRRIDLTLTEFKVLTILMRNQDQVVTHQSLVEAVWGDIGDSSNLVKRHIHRLRQKLGKEGEGRRWIVSVRGVGYRFVGAIDDTPERFMPAVM